MFVPAVAGSVPHGVRTRDVHAQVTQGTAAPHPHRLYHRHQLCYHLVAGRVGPHLPLHTGKSSTTSIWDPYLKFPLYVLKGHS